MQKEVKREHPEISMIMLSGYDDLDYVRQALKNGAIDYILKHELDEKVLVQVLSRAEETGKNFGKGEDSITADNQVALRRNFMMNLFSGCYYSEEEIRFRSGVLKNRYEKCICGHYNGSAKERKCNFFLSAGVCNFKYY